MPLKVKVRVANVLIVGFLLEEETPSLILGDCSGHLAGFSVVIINITISNNISIIMTIIKIIPLSFSAQEQQTMPSLIRRTRSFVCLLSMKTLWYIRTVMSTK